MGFALALFLAVCFGFMARRSFKNFEREAELNAPLIDSEDRRLDAALRDAEAGFNVCPVCEFENFKRFRFCTICGEPIVVQSDDSEEDEAMKKAKMKVKLSSIAQRRKEWTRKLDVEGRVYWYRDSRVVKTDALPKAFVVAFEPNVVEKADGNPSTPLP
ncbi:hypothetical protein PHMEG_00029788, partial [Phytophthora megakarya]